MLHFLTAARKTVDRILDGFAIVLFLAIFLVILMQVFMRYSLNSPLIWSEELARYLYVWVCYLGWALATRSGSHIKISAVLDALPAPARRFIGLANHVLVIVFSVVMIVLGTDMTIRNTDVPTVTLLVSYGLVYLAVPVSCLLLIFYALLNLLGGVEDRGGTLS